VHDSEDSARAAYKSVSQTFQRCISDWRREADVLSPGADLVALSSLLLVGKGDFADMEWAIALDRHEADGEIDWHVSVGLAYY